MGKYAEKSELVDAVQWDGKDHPDVVVNRLKRVKQHEHAPGQVINIHPDHGLVVGTLDVIEKGDFIVTSEKGVKSGVPAGPFLDKYGPIAPAAEPEPYGICHACALKDDCPLQDTNYVIGLAVASCEVYEPIEGDE